jgi:hypothetical protein
MPATNLAWLTGMVDALYATTFEQANNIYLADGTSLFETLAAISAADASRPVSSTCASLAAQVDHVRFYLDTTQGELQGTLDGEPDWSASWQLRNVTPEEWNALQERLKVSYARVRAMMVAFEEAAWHEHVGDCLAMLVHSAYQLGEIRQALCVLTASSQGA